MNSDIILVEEKNNKKKFHFSIIGRIEGSEIEIVQLLQNAMNDLNMNCQFVKFHRYHVLVREDASEA